jgi:hypothetical protein
MAAARASAGGDHLAPDDSASQVSWSVVVDEQRNVGPAQEVPMQFPEPKAPPPGFRHQGDRLLAMQLKDKITPRVVYQAQVEVHPSHLLMQPTFSLTLLKPLLKVLLLQLLKQHVICWEALRSRQLAWQSRKLRQRGVVIVQSGGDRCLALMLRISSSQPLSGSWVLAKMNDQCL